MPRPLERSACGTQPDRKDNIAVSRRARPPGSKNLRKHEYQVIQLHLKDRIRKQKDTQFVFDGVIQDYHTAIRKIGRALGGVDSPLTDTLPPLPSRVALRTPPPSNILASEPPLISLKEASCPYASSQRQSETVPVSTTSNLTISTNLPILGHPTTYSSISTKNLIYAGVSCIGDEIHSYLLSSLDETPFSWSKILDTLSKCQCGHAQSLLGRYNADRLIDSQNPPWLDFLLGFPDFDGQNLLHSNTLQMFLSQGVDVDCSLKSYSWTHGRVPVKLYYKYVAANGADCWPTVLDYFYYYDRGTFNQMAPFSKKLWTPVPTRPGALGAFKNGTQALQTYMTARIDPQSSMLKPFLNLLFWEQLALGSPDSLLTSSYEIDLDLVCQLFNHCDIRISNFAADEVISLLVSTVRNMPRQSRPNDRVTLLDRLIDNRVYNNVPDNSPGNAVQTGGSKHLFCEIAPTVSVKGWSEMKEFVRQNQFGLHHVVLRSLNTGFDINSEVVRFKRCSNDRILLRNLSPLASLLTEVDQGGDGLIVGCCASYDLLKYLVAKGARLSIRGGQSDSCPLAFLRFVLWEDPSDLLQRIEYLVGHIDNFNNSCSYCSTYLLEECLALGCGRYDSRRKQRFEVFQFFWSKGIRQRHGSLLSALIQSAAPSRLIQACVGWSDLNQYCHDYSSRRRDYRSHTRKELVSLTPLQAAAGKIDEKLVRYLLKKQAPVNAPARGHGGRTALQAICEAEATVPEMYQKKLRIVRLLLETGAKVNASPARSNGSFVLTEAIRADSTEIVTLLIKNGVDVNAPSGVPGKLALDLASLHGLKGIVNLLLSAGAVSFSPGASGYDGAISLAEHRTHRDVVYYIRKFVEERLNCGFVEFLPEPQQDLADAQNHGAVNGECSDGSDGQDGTLGEEELESICYNRTQDMIMGYYVEGKVGSVVHGPQG